MATEAQIPKTARDIRIYLIGLSGRQLEIPNEADDFSDNRERAEKVEHSSRGSIYAVTEGNQPATTGSMSLKFYTENNALADSVLDAIQGNGATWSAENTGTTGSPYVAYHCLTLKRVIVGAAPDGGDMVSTYEKTTFDVTDSSAIDGISVSVSWTCYGTVTRTGPT